MSKTALKIAQNIMNLAGKILNGTAEFSDDLKYDEYDYSFMLFALRSGDFKTTVALPNCEPTPEQIEAAANLLGEGAPKLDQIYMANRDIVIPYLAYHAWTKMSENKYSPVPYHYNHFHIFREDMGYQPSSPELLGLLGVSPEEYAAIDKPNALKAIFETMEFAMDSFRIALDFKTFEVEEGLANPDDLTQSFMRIVDKKEDELSSALLEIKDQSRLTNKEISDYLLLCHAGSPSARTEFGSPRLN